MIENFAICSLAFGDAYIKQLHRLKESVRNIYSDVTFFSWINAYPHGSKPHKVSPYGFKVHAINAARAQGYDKIIWLDTAILLCEPVDYWFNLVPLYGVVAAKDDNPLQNHIGERAMEYYGQPDITGFHLVGGSVYVLDFSIDLCRKVFFHWEKAEVEGMFASDGRHRHDESAMAISLYLNGSEPTPYDVCRYNNGEGSICIKKHFK